MIIYRMFDYIIENNIPPPPTVCSDNKPHEWRISPVYNTTVAHFTCVKCGAYR